MNNFLMNKHNFSYVITAMVITLNELLLEGAKCQECMFNLITLPWIRHHDERVAC